MREFVETAFAHVGLDWQSYVKYDARYERLGFVRTGEFSTPDGSHTVATMWRDAR